MILFQNAQLVSVQFRILLALVTVSGPGCRKACQVSQLAQQLTGLTDFVPLGKVNMQLLYKMSVRLCTRQKRARALVIDVCSKSCTLLLVKLTLEIKRKIKGAFLKPKRFEVFYFDLFSLGQDMLFTRLVPQRMHFSTLLSYTLTGLCFSISFIYNYALHLNIVFVPFSVIFLSIAVLYWCWLPCALQDQLLQQLGVGTGTPPTSTAPQLEAWPLTVPPHTLALLLEVLLLRQQRERESKVVRAGTDATILAMWSRFLASLKAAIFNFDNRSEQFEGSLFRSVPL